MPAESAGFIRLPTHKCNTPLGFASVEGQSSSLQISRDSSFDRQQFSLRWRSTCQNASLSDGKLRLSQALALLFSDQVRQCPLPPANVCLGCDRASVKLSDLVPLILSIEWFDSGRGAPLKLFNPSLER
jgi:hypothetical protein